MGGGGQEVPVSPCATPGWTLTRAARARVQPSQARPTGSVPIDT